MMGPKAKRAFTLIELLTVIAIVVMVMGMALPNFMAMIKQQRWVAAISSFQNVVRRCRILGINERRDYSVELCVDDDSEIQYFRIEVESSLLETIPNLQEYYEKQCNYYRSRMPIDWWTTFQSAGGRILNPPLNSWSVAPNMKFEYQGPYYDVNRRRWGVDQRIMDNFLVDDSNVLPHGITVDFEDSTNLVNLDSPPNSNLYHMPQYGWDYTKDLRFDGRGTLVQTLNPEIVLRNRTGEVVRVQILRSTGRVRKLW